MIPLEDMRALVRRGLGGLDEMDMPNAEADRLLNMSLWELESKFPFKEKECLTRTPLIVGVGEYMLPNNLDALITVSIVRGRLEGEDLAASNQPPVRYKLIKSGADEESEAQPSSIDTSLQGRPTHYFRRNRVIVVSPTPRTGEWVLELLMWRAVASIIDDPTLTIGLPRNWHELVVEGAIVRGHFFNEDYNLAQQASNFQTSKVRSAVTTDTKEDRDNRYAGVRVIHEWPDEQPPRRHRRRS